MKPKKVTVELTILEAQALLYAANSVADDVRSGGPGVMGWNRYEGAAYWRATEKLAEARYKARTGGKK